MNSLPISIPEPIRWDYSDNSQDKKDQEKEKTPEPSIPWGWEDTKNWSYR